MSKTCEPRLPFEAVDPDQASRTDATDPARNVVLEASAGTGKTSVLVDRYVNLLLAGVDPGNILAITFTRKAAAEMRQRIVQRIRDAQPAPSAGAARWRELRERLGQIAVSTIDAFCLSLVQEFPLEADVDPGFEMADETEIPRLIDEALDAALRIGRNAARSEPDLAMLLVQLGERRLREGLATLLERRTMSRQILGAVLETGPRDLSAAEACGRTARRLRALFTGIPGGLPAFLQSGPIGHPQYAMLAADLARLCAGGDGPFEAQQDAALRGLVERIRAYFMTQDGRPRKAKGFGQAEFKKEHCASEGSWRRHREAVEAVAPSVADAVQAFRRDLNVILSRGVWRMFELATAQYVRTLESHGVLDFVEVQSRAIALLRRMDEFSRSRYRLEARYRHVLVDEFQDTSPAQWELISLLVRSWGEGAGASADALPPSIFIVGDRKQSIYGFRDADVGLFDAAADFIGALRPEGRPRRTISVSFRARPALLSFVNDVFHDIASAGGEPTRRDAFRYGDDDRFPVTNGAQRRADEAPVGFLAAGGVETAAELVADEIVRLLSGGASVRDRRTGAMRTARPGDIAVLFRSRDSHRAYEAALDRRRVPTYVYKGLGFFDADEVQDAMALLRFLASPTSDLRAAALLRSRIVRLSDRGVARIAPGLAAALTSADLPAAAATLDDEDGRALAIARAAMPQWLATVDRVTPSDLLTMLLRETAYAFEIRGPRRDQARENIKKLRALVRRIQNRGYLTLARLADHLDRLAVGDEANAVIDALDAVNLMTVHAAKGLEFPIVFVVNLGRGSGGPREPIRVATDASGAPAIGIADFDSDADEDARDREREESKRLLYVALTRARDRLYLSGVVTDSAFRPGRGSLGEVLPRSLVAKLEESAAAAPEPDRMTFAGTSSEGAWIDCFDCHGGV